MTDIDIEFCRHLLKQCYATVKKEFPNVRFSDPWVWCAGRDHWEFHYRPSQGRGHVMRNYKEEPPFYWHGSAGNAYEARYKGWMAWLNSKGVET